MAILAKHSGNCPVCGRGYRKGSPIERLPESMVHPSWLWDDYEYPNADGSPRQRLLSNRLPVRYAHEKCYAKWLREQTPRVRVRVRGKELRA